MEEIRLLSSLLAPLPCTSLYIPSTIESASDMLGTRISSHLSERATSRNISAAGMITSALSSFSLNCSIRSSSERGANSAYSCLSVATGNERESPFTLARRNRRLMLPPEPIILVPGKSSAYFSNILHIAFLSSGVTAPASIRSVPILNE